MIQVKNVTAGYGMKPVVENISFDMEAGEILGVIGPNGSGKSTLLKCMYGALKPDDGEIIVDNKRLGAYTQKNIAKKIAVLPQQTDVAFSYTVRQVVELGRYPHQKGWFSFQQKQDEHIVDKALQETGVLSFSNHPMDSLSGGEKQRVLLARALAQEPDILLLDEPTNHLDISYQLNLLDTLKDWSKTKQLTVIAVLHDLNMAAMYSHRVLLLEDGRQKALDKPSVVMEKNRLEHVYQAHLERKEHPSVPSPLITLEPSSDTLERKRENVLDSLSIEKTPGHVCLMSPFHWKTFSSAVVGAGFGWHRYFVNRHVDKDYACDQPKQEYTAYLKKIGLDIDDTAAMMTAARLDDGAFVRMAGDNHDVFVYATAGTSNAVDVSKSYEYYSMNHTAGTINLWIFVAHRLSEAAYAQIMMTATEAKTKALMDYRIYDPKTKTLATGTSTDSVLVAALSEGEEIEYGGTITPVGKTIGKAVYDAVSRTLNHYLKRRSGNEI
ncbi:iron complex transport system ATP-binding protein [Alteribacillus persepolensis]|uniref:Iron complex transport system ATP-binding protein n=1 Tax=Alteribacillus persepolensis TaxID=568899 RepID=A0A1G7ZL45_9BACI|nr:heme ABC transporter ATP-binding protein [Alteribacillus persepolensis]SDH09379.1 iron complex transport system ATP-binding protein [Alteribacillus persepolensis]